MRGKRGAALREENAEEEEPNPVQKANLGDLNIDDDDEEDDDSLASGSEPGSEDVLEGPLSSGGEEDQSDGGRGDPDEDDAAIEEALQEYMRATQVGRPGGGGAQIKGG